MFSLAPATRARFTSSLPRASCSTFFAPNEIMVHALAIDSKGRLYAATSPNGRVYRLDSKGQAEVYCTPGKTYYLGDDFRQGRSLVPRHRRSWEDPAVAPGQSTPAKVETYFETTEANITALAMDMDGNLLGRHQSSRLPLPHRQGQPRLRCVQFQRKGNKTNHRRARRNDFCVHFQRERQRRTIIRAQVQPTKPRVNLTTQPRLIHPQKRHRPPLPAVTTPLQFSSRHGHLDFFPGKRQWQAATWHRLPD